MDQFRHAPMQSISFREIFQGYRKALELNGAALQSFLVAAHPSIIKYLADRIEKGEKIGDRKMIHWAKVNDAAIMEGYLSFEW